MVQMSRRRVWPFVALVAVTGLALGTGAALFHSSPRTAATVDGRPVTEKSIDQEVAEINRNPPYVNALEAQGPSGGVPPAGRALARQVLTRRIYIELVSEEVRRRHLAVGPAEVGRGRDAVVAELGHDFGTGASDAARGEALLSGFSEKYGDLLVHRAAERAAVDDAVSGTRVDDGAVSRYYGTNLDEFTEVCARHVVRPTRAEADDVANRLRGGADFAEVAARESTDGLTAGLGGDIGCASPARYPPELAAVLRTQPVGDIGAPTETFLGWHVVQVSRRKVRTLEDAGAEIRARLVAEQRQRVDSWLEDRAKRAKIRVTPAWGKFDTSQPQPQVR